MVYSCQIVKLPSRYIKVKGILEADKFLEKKMNLNFPKEYIRRLRKVSKSKLNGRNLVRGVNTWEVSLLRGKMNCRLWIKKLGSCLPYMEHYTLSQM